MKRIPRSSHFYKWSTANPVVAEIELGEVITVETLDNTGGTILTENDYGPQGIDRVNPSTGPIWLRGAEPGDSVCIEIQGIELESPGHLQLIRGFGLLSDEVKSPMTRLLAIEGGSAVFLGSIPLPLDPMIGTIGTTPPGEPLGTIFLGRFGGNLDDRDIRVGSRAYFPVFHPGALIGMGDLHALQGDGEVCCTAVEAAGTIKASVTLLKGLELSWPRVETPDHWSTIGVASTLEQAVELAGEEMARLLVDWMDISLSEAVMLTSVVVDFRINASPPHAGKGVPVSVRACIPKSLLPAPYRHGYHRSGETKLPIKQRDH